MATEYIGVDPQPVSKEKKRWSQKLIDVLIGKPKEDAQHPQQTQQTQQQARNEQHASPNRKRSQSAHAKIKSPAIKQDVDQKKEENELLSDMDVLDPSTLTQPTVGEFAGSSLDGTFAYLVSLESAEHQEPLESRLYVAEEGLYIDAGLPIVKKIFLPFEIIKLTRLQHNPPSINIEVVDPDTSSNTTYILYTKQGHLIQNSMLKVAQRVLEKRNRRSSLSIMEGLHKVSDDRAANQRLLARDWDDEDD